jgi:hypothetical protein
MISFDEFNWQERNAREYNLYNAGVVIFINDFTIFNEYGNTTGRY